MKKRITMLTTSLLALSFSLTAAAATTSAQTSVADSQSLLSKITSKTKLSWYGMLEGLSAGKLSAYQTDNKGQLTTDRVDIYNSVSLGYMVHPKFKVFVNPRFYIFPVNGGDFSWLDWRVGVSSSGVFKVGNFSWDYACLRAYIPTTGTSQDSGLIVQPNSLSLLGYQMGQSRWSLGMWSFLRANIYNDSTAKSVFDVYLDPFVSFRAASNLSFQLIYEMSANLKSGAVGAATEYIAPKVVWDVLPKLTVEPSVRFFPTGKINMDSTKLVLEVSGTFL